MNIAGYFQAVFDASHPRDPAALALARYAAARDSDVTDADVAHWTSQMAQTAQRDIMSRTYHQWLQDVAASRAPADV